MFLKDNIVIGLNADYKLGVNKNHVYCVNCKNQLLKYLSDHTSKYHHQPNSQIHALWLSFEKTI